MPRLLSLFAPLAALLAIPLGSGAVAAEAKPDSLASPDGRLVVDFYLKAGVTGYTIHREGQLVLRESRLGLVRDDADFSTKLRLLGESPMETVEDRYEILTAKRRVNTYRANRKVFHLSAATGQPMDIIFQVSNDGVAFRYFFPGPKAETRRLSAEVTSFHFLPDTRAWLQPMSVAKSGWSQVNPCYEEYYEKDIPAGTPSPSAAGWVYPALFRSGLRRAEVSSEESRSLDNSARAVPGERQASATQAGDTWLLISEGSLARNYCGTRLRTESPDGEYAVGFPDPRENFQGGPVNPESTLPWLTPWRIIAIGSLKTIAESTLGTDLAEPPASPVDPAIEPGKASWSWPLMGDRNTNYEVQKKFIDYAAGMGWRYCLIDGLWDKQIGYDRVKELVDYARGKNVWILLWYNSAGNWNAAPQTPRDRMLTHESRVQEFERLKAMGVAGLKVDFFGGDGQSVINYYHDILDDAAPYGFLMNFHGATLPRGWQRTYPHLMSMEAIKGLEFITFEQKNADEEPAHAAMLPFTRNVFDPMDFTPMVLDHINRISRRTTSAFELALAVLFTSGIQHYAEIPEGMAKAPDYVRNFIKGVPSVWDDTRFLAGHPGKFAVLARRGEGRWYVAGINAEPAAKTLTLDLGELSVRGAGTLITDGGDGNLSFRREAVQLASGKKLEVTLQPQGGFVLVLE